MATQYNDEYKKVIGNGMAYYTEADWSDTIEYYCIPQQPGDLITASTWKVNKIITVTATGKFKAGKCSLRAGGSPDYKYSAADLNTVKAHSYS